jgi:hypothetical protein
MSRPTVSDIKLYSRIDNDIEDSLLLSMENSAYNFICRYVNRPIETDPDAELSDNGIYYTDDIRIAELMLIDWNYNNRSAGANNADIPPAVKFILDIYRICNV